jgi:hypothetical protein
VYISVLQYALHLADTEAGIKSLQDLGGQQPCCGTHITPACRAVCTGSYCCGQAGS